MFSLASASESRHPSLSLSVGLLKPLFELQVRIHFSFLSSLKALLSFWGRESDHDSLDPPGSTLRVNKHDMMFVDDTRRILDRTVGGK